MLYLPRCHKCQEQVLKGQNAVRCPEEQIPVPQSHVSDSYLHFLLCLYPHTCCVTTEHLFATYEFHQGASKQLNNRCCRFIKSNFTSATSRAATNDYFRFEEVDVLKCFVFFHKPKIQEDVRNQKIIPFEKLKSDHFDVFFRLSVAALVTSLEESPTSCDSGKSGRPASVSVELSF